MKRSDKKKLNARILCVLLSLISCLTTEGVLTAEDDSLNSPSVTFESFLTNPPIIENAEFEIIKPSPSPEVLERIKKHNGGILGLDTVYMLRRDGTNFVLTQPNSYNGSIGGTEWMFTRGVLNLADPRINTPDAIGPAAGWPQIVTWKFLNLGIERMIPNTIQWKQGSDHFSAKSENGLGLTNFGAAEVQLHYVDGVPLTCLIKYSQGPEEEIQYRYDPTFFNGKLPVEYNVTGSYPGTAPSEDFSLRIKDLQISSKHLDVDNFDPKIILKDKYRVMFMLSNDISYWITRSGALQPVMPAPQAQQELV